MTLPDTASVGDSGHVTDHNLIVDELGRLETDKLDVATATGTYRTIAGRHARAYVSGTVSLTSGTVTTIPLAAETHDTHTMHDTVTNNSRIVLNRVGVWLVQGQVSFVANSTGIRQVRIQVNGALGTYGAYVATPAAASPFLTLLNMSTVVKTTVTTDYVELTGFQNSGGSLDVNAGPSETWLSAIWIGE